MAQLSEVKVSEAVIVSMMRSRLRKWRVRAEKAVDGGWAVEEKKRSREGA